MKSLKIVRTTLVAAAVVGAALALVTFVRAQGADAAAAKGTYKVDPVHSSVIFKVKHFNTSNFYGRFNSATGSFDLDEGGSIDVKIDINSLNSGNPKRDLDLKNPDFFSAKEFPEARFKSTSIKKAGDTMYDVEGDMTLHGVTKPITAKVEFTGAGKGMRGRDIAGIEARFTIKRTEFGMKAMTNMLGDDVELIVALEGGR